MSEDGSQKCVRRSSFWCEHTRSGDRVLVPAQLAEVEKARSTLTLNERTRLVTAELARAATEASPSGGTSPG